MQETKQQTEGAVDVGSTALLGVTVDKIAFEGPKEPDRGYTVRASYLKEPHAGDALIEIFKDGKLLRHFLFPAYKIWNISAHFRDIVDGEIEKSARGYEMAAWDGISGAVILTPNDKVRQVAGRKETND